MKRRKSTKKIVSLVLAIFVAILAVGGWLFSKNNQESQASKKSLNYAFGGDPVSLNPINSNDLWGLKTINMVYSPLARTSNDGKVHYELAKSIEQSDDGKSITVKLRDDVKWSDGVKFTADDVVFTYTQKAKKENGKYESLWVGDSPVVAKKVDDYTVEFDIATPSAAAVNNLTNETYIIPEHIYKEQGDFSVNDLGKYPTVGTGPYVLDDFKAGENLTFKANKYYYGGTVGVKTITAKIIKNPDTLKVALQKGEVDLASVNASDVDDLKNNGLKTQSYNSGDINYLGINSEVITDKRVRQAIFYALNRSEINKAAFPSDDFYLSANSFLPADNKYYNKKTPAYKQSIKKAKALLKEAGASNLHFALAYDSTNQIFTKEAALIQEQLKEIGVTVDLQGGDGDTILAELKKDGTTKYPLFLRSYSMGNDPDTYKRLFQTGGASNYFKLADKTVDQLFTTGGTQLDDKERASTYDELQETLADTAVVYPISSDKGTLATSSTVSGIETSNLYPIYTIGDWSKVTLK